MRRPSRDDVLMNIAREVARRSTCERAQVGAVLVRDSRIISTGYNGSPSGMPHCVCKALESCNRTVHAESNAIVFSARYGVSTMGTTLYTTMSPCLECAKLIINAGISRVVYDEPYRDMSGVLLLKDGGVTSDWLNV